MKIAEIKLAGIWQKLEMLVPEIIGSKVELYNASISIAEIHYTESDEQPTNESYFKVLEAHQGAILRQFSQPIWVKAGYNSARLMVSKIEEY